MCGIAGLINFNGDAISPVILKNMTDSIAHRGPDGEAIGLKAMLVLVIDVFIIDLSPVYQPMISADHRWVLNITEKSITTENYQ